MHDYRPLSDFPLAWRFAARTREGSGSDVMQYIKALSTESARKVAPRALEICRGIEYATLVRADDPSRVRFFLSDLPVRPQTTIIVSWSNDTAVETTWDVFCRRWNDFCYPGSDDVSIWSPSDRWSLCYRHDETLFYDGDW